MKNDGAVQARYDVPGAMMLPGMSKEVRDGVAMVVHEDCRVRNVAQYADVPYRKAGLIQLLTMDDFVKMVKARMTGNTAIFVNRGEARAIFNIDGWQDDVASFEVKLTPEWNEWTQWDGKSLSQGNFCDFLEDHQKEIVKPCGAELLEMVANFRQMTRVEYGSSYRRSDGQIGIEYKEKKEGAGGRDMALPSEFVMHLPVVKGAEALTMYEVKARLRVRVDADTHKLILQYQLVRPDIPVDNAIKDLVQHLQQVVSEDVTVFAGGVRRSVLQAISEL